MPLLTNGPISDGNLKCFDSGGEVCSIPCSAFKDTSELTLSSPHQARLLQLPQELLVNIISHLGWRDICRLRLINRQLHNLIHDTESTIVRKHLSETAGVLLESFKPAGSLLSLDYQIELRYRLRECRRLASLLATRCCAKLEPQSPLDEEKAWRTRKMNKLRDDLMTGLFALYEFLCRFQEVVLRSLHEFEEYSTVDVVRLGSILSLDQQRIIENLPQGSLVRIIQAWRILKGVANSRGVPFNQKSTKYPYTTVKVVLVLGGLDRFRSLINKTSLEERIQDLESFNAEIWHGLTWKPVVLLEGAPLSSIHHLAAPPKRVSSADFPKSMSPIATVTFISRQHVCEPSVAAVVLRLSGTLDNVLPVKQYICEVITEKGDSFSLLSWNTPDDGA